MGLLAPLLFVTVLLCCALASRDPYAVLGVSRRARASELKRAHRERARQLHPDKAGAAGQAQFLELQAAYELLSDPEQRRLYDSLGHEGVQRARHFKAAQQNAQAHAQHRSSGPQHHYWSPPPPLLSATASLEDGSFERTVLRSNSPWVIMLFAHSSPACRAYAAHWEKAAELLRGVSRLGRVDVGTQQGLAERLLSVRLGSREAVLPTILAFAPACRALRCARTLREAPTARAVTDFAVNVARLPAVRTLLTAQALHAFMGDKEQDAKLLMLMHGAPQRAAASRQLRLAARAAAGRGVQLAIAAGEAAQTASSRYSAPAAPSGALWRARGSRPVAVRLRWSLEEDASSVLAWLSSAGIADGAFGDEDFEEFEARPTRGEVAREHARATWDNVCDDPLPVLTALGVLYFAGAAGMRSRPRRATPPPAARRAASAPAPRPAPAPIPASAPVPRRPCRATITVLNSAAAAELPSRGAFLLTLLLPAPPSSPTPAAAAAHAAAAAAARALLESLARRFAAEQRVLFLCLDASVQSAWAAFAASEATASAGFALLAWRPGGRRRYCRIMAGLGEQDGQPGMLATQRLERLLDGQVPGDKWLEGAWPELR